MNHAESRGLKIQDTQNPILILTANGLTTSVTHQDSAPFWCTSILLDDRLRLHMRLLAKPRTEATSKDECFHKCDSFFYFV